MADTLKDLAALEPAAVVQKLGSTMTGLTTDEATKRLAQYGSNTIHTKKVTLLALVARQFKNPILILLLSAAAGSALLKDFADASVISVIIALSVALSLSTEYRAQRAADDLQKRATRRATVLRDGQPIQMDVSNLVPGDVVRLTLGSVIPADLRLIETQDLECDESIITGESLPVTKSAAANAENDALMGTIVRAGAATGLVVLTGSATEFGVIAERLSESNSETDFQRGLRRFSTFLLRIAIIQAVLVVLVSWALGRNVLQAVLFALALAVGITPQLLPAVVSTALALGSRTLAKNGVLVKRLVCIEDLGDIDVLVTDKTGTLTAGAVAFNSAVPIGQAEGANAQVGAAGNLATTRLTLLGLLATDANYQEAASTTAGLNPLDSALWATNAQLATSSLASGTTRLASIAFDHNRRIASALVTIDGKPILISKGSPEDVLARCSNPPAEANAKLEELYAAGARVIAVASRPLPNATTITAADETSLTLEGFLTFADPYKADVQDSLQQLEDLGIEVKIATGDSAQVAVTVCRQVGLAVLGTLTGTQVDALSDDQLKAIVMRTTIFARVSPEQKARIIKAIQANGESVGFMGDGVNDAIALHDADVGISVDTATDVAKDAADVVLLEKDLAVLAKGVRLGRQVFNNTMKYVLMGTSSDFGNILSAAIGSMILPFLPMLPGQILLQGLLYDSSQLALPTDRVDPEQTRRPSHWNIGFIGRFMVVFGLASSIFDFATFGLMLWVFHAKASEFQSGWFIESLATATLIVFAVRTRRVPFLRSRPSRALTISVFAVVTVGALITYSPAAPLLGFSALPPLFFFALVLMILAYLVVVEVAKSIMFRRLQAATS